MHLQIIFPINVNVIPCLCVYNAHTTFWYGKMKKHFAFKMQHFNNTRKSENSVKIFFILFMVFPFGYFFVVLNIIWFYIISDLIFGIFYMTKKKKKNLFYG